MILRTQTNNLTTKIIMLQKINKMKQKNQYNIEIHKEINKLYAGNYLKEELSRWINKSRREPTLAVI